MRGDHAVILMLLGAAEASMTSIRLDLFINDRLGILGSASDLYHSFIHSIIVFLICAIGGKECEHLIRRG